MSPLALPCLAALCSKYIWISMPFVSADLGNDTEITREYLNAKPHFVPLPSGPAKYNTWLYTSKSTFHNDGRFPSTPPCTSISIKYKV